MTAVIFDLYETLVTENHPEWFGNPTLADRLGIDEALCRREWEARYEGRMTGTIADYSTVLREICGVAGVQHPEQEIAHLAAERLEAKARPFIRVETGVIEALKQLRSRQLKIGLITNCTCEEVASWGISPFPELVDATVFSYDVGVIKPKSEIYKIACSRLGAEPGSSYFVGDGGSDELRGAQAAGLHPIWATWFIERWPWDWVGNVSKAAGDFPRCRSIADLPALIDAD